MKTLIVPRVKFFIGIGNMWKNIKLFPLGKDKINKTQDSWFVPSQVIQIPFRRVSSYLFAPVSQDQRHNLPWDLFSDSWRNPKSVWSGRRRCRSAGKRVGGRVRWEISISSRSHRALAAQNKCVSLFGRGGRPNISCVSKASANAGYDTRRLGWESGGINFSHTHLRSRCEKWDCPGERNTNTERDDFLDFSCDADFLYEKWIFSLLDIWKIDCKE